MPQQQQQKTELQPAQSDSSMSIMDLVSPLHLGAREEVGTSAALVAQISQNENFEPRQSSSDIDSHKKVDTPLSVEPGEPPLFSCVFSCGCTTSSALRTVLNWYPYLFRTTNVLLSNGASLTPTFLAVALADGNVSLTIFYVVSAYVLNVLMTMGFNENFVKEYLPSLIKRNWAYRLRAGSAFLFAIATVFPWFQLAKEATKHLPPWLAWVAPFVIFSSIVYVITTRTLGGTYLFEDIGDAICWRYLKRYRADLQHFFQLHENLGIYGSRVHAETFSVNANSGDSNAKQFAQWYLDELQKPLSSETTTPLIRSGRTRLQKVAYYMMLITQVILATLSILMVPMWFGFTEGGLNKAHDDLGKQIPLTVTCACASLFLYTASCVRYPHAVMDFSKQLLQRVSAFCRSSQVSVTVIVGLLLMGFAVGSGAGVTDGVKGEMHPDLFNATNATNASNTMDPHPAFRSVAAKTLFSFAPYVWIFQNLIAPWAQELGGFVLAGGVVNGRAALEVIMKCWALQSVGISFLSAMLAYMFGYRAAELKEKAAKEFKEKPIVEQLLLTLPKEIEKAILSGDVSSLGFTVDDIDVRDNNEDVPSALPAAEQTPQPSFCGRVGAAGSRMLHCCALFWSRPQSKNQVELQETLLTMHKGA